MMDSKQRLPELDRSADRAPGEEDVRGKGTDAETPLQLPRLPLSPYPLPRVGGALPPIPMRGEYVLGELLAYQDEEFVANAYRALLHREPDPAGFVGYLTHLRAGNAKLDVLHRISESPEGRSRNVKVRGLSRSMMLHRWKRIPLLGWLIALVQHLAALPVFLAQLQRQETLAFQRQTELRAAVDSLATAVEDLDEARSKDVANVVDRLSLSLHQLNNQKASAKQAREIAGHIAEVQAEVGKVLSLEAQLRARERSMEASIDRVERSLGDMHLREDGLEVSMERLERSLGEVREGKADVEWVRAEVHVAADRVREVLEAVRALESTKADVQALGEMASKVSQAQVDMRTLEEELRRLAASKADLGMLSSTVQLVTRLTANTEKLGADLNAAQGHLSQKADAEYVARRLDDALAMLEKRPETAGVRSIVDEMLARERLDPPVDHALDGFYVEFENRFRGSREEIKQRLSRYLPYLAEAAERHQGARIVDLGCGRGELLEMLKEAGISASGVDLNTMMVAECRALGLEVVEQDAMAYLRDVPESSLAAVSAIHMIEHLPFRRRLEFFGAALRALQPGGVAIFETPNPENVTVGACNFWMDPTHLQPLPPATTAAIVEMTGFSRVEILRLHPYPPEAHLPAVGGKLRDHLNHILFGPQDYAVVAWKPGS